MCDPHSLVSVDLHSRAWTLTRDFVGSTIVGATKLEQLDDVLRASDAKIPENALAAVDEITREILYPMG